jgi:predicted negative regulator of RcsB-dependent stress response
MSNDVERQSGSLASSTSRLAQGAPVLVSVRRATRITHWAFAGYLCLAAAAALYSFVQAQRFDRALARLRWCVARADSACTSAELEMARRIRSTDVRLEIGDASLGLLLHEVDRAGVTEAKLENPAEPKASPRSADVRADLLLLRGDIASVRGNQVDARSDFEAAQPLLADPSLVAVRLERIDARERAAHDHSTDELNSLRQDFSDLFVAAREGNREITDLRISKAQTWIGRVSHLEARQKLGLAVDAARRASYIVNSANHPAAVTPLGEPPSPPVRGIVDYSSGYHGSYEAQLAMYRDKLDRYNNARSALEDRQQKHSAEASETSGAAIEQANQLLDQALRTLAALPEPLRDAANAAPPQGPLRGSAMGPGTPFATSIR